MVCKSCGATVKEGQFTCSSCGAYLSKETMVETSSLEERGRLAGSGNLYSSKLPVNVEDGWKWYMFVTYGIIPLWAFSNLLYVIKGFSSSFMLGLIYLSIAIFGYITHKKLVDFSTNALIYVYIYSFSPLYILLYTYLKVKKAVGNSIDVGALFTQNGTIMGLIIGTIIFGIINIIYFQGKKYEFQY